PNKNDESLRAYFQAQRTAAAADRTGAAIPDSVRETAETRPQIAPVDIPTEPSRTKLEQSIEPVQRVNLAVEPSVTQQQLADNEAG
ncbi:hypothetical protein ACI3QN_12420, partial [Propionibacterium freudenreichii]|uniref:hypothetical protein n=1 Tax=Propionibacterium freudenreichii TaxID=1744 RepID=UPI0038553A44